MSNSNHFFFFRMLWGAFAHADWDEAARRGIIALIVEFFRTLMGLNSWPFFVPAESGWRSFTIRPILEEHGIDSWGWGKQGNEVFFQVKLRQANWAQYLLRQNGVPISGQLLDEGKRSAYRPAPRRTVRPTPGATPIEGNLPMERNMPIERNMSVPIVKPEATTSFLRDPVGEINRTVDRWAKW